MTNARQIIEQFWHLAEGRCAFDLKNGSHLEGYILEVQEENIIFASGGPLASDQNESISIEDIDLSTLYLWSDTQKCYLNAQLDTV